MRCFRRTTNTVFTSDARRFGTLSGRSRPRRCRTTRPDFSICRAGMGECCAFFAHRDHNVRPVGDGVDYCANTFAAIPVYSAVVPSQAPLEPDSLDLTWVGSLLTH